MRITYAVATDSGFFLNENQENYYLDGRIKELSSVEGHAKGNAQKAEYSFVVCDGNGVNKSGAKAAFETVMAFKDYVPNIIYMDPVGYTSYCNYKVRINTSDENETESSFSALILRNEHFLSFGVGKSKIYRFVDGDLSVILSAEADKKLSNRIKDTEIRPVVSKGEITGQREIFALVTGGVFDTLSEEVIKDIVAKDESAENMADKLILRAIKFGSFENVTAMIVMIENEPEIEEIEDEESALVEGEVLENSNEEVHAVEKTASEEKDLESSDDAANILSPSMLIDVSNAEIEQNDDFSEESENDDVLSVEAMEISEVEVTVDEDMCSAEMNDPMEENISDSDPVNDEILIDSILPDDTDVDAISEEAEESKTDDSADKGVSDDEARKVSIAGAYGYSY